MRIREKIIFFLEKEKLKHPESEWADREEVIRFFKEISGLCLAYATLWGYARKIADLPEAQNNKPKDDLDYLTWITSLLHEVLGVRELTAFERFEIDRFISHVFFFQRGDVLTKKPLITGTDDRDSAHIDLIVQDTQNRSWIRSFQSKIHIFTLPMFERWLRQIIHPGTLFFVGIDLTADRPRTHHVVSIYQNVKDHKMILDNYNQPASTFEPEDYAGLASTVWEASNRLRYLEQSQHENLKAEKGPAALSLRKFDLIAFNFKEDPVFNYPKEEDLAKKYEEFKVVANLLQNPHSSHDPLQKQCVLTLPTAVIIETIKDSTISLACKDFLIETLKPKVSTHGPLVESLFHAYKQERETVSPPETMQLPEATPK